MNPFNQQASYDGYLAELVSKVNKASPLNVQEALVALQEYLPESNYSSDYKIILKTIEPYFGITDNKIVNKMVYFLAKKLGVECLRPFQVKWTRFNISSDDVYARKLLNEYFDVSAVAQEFEAALTFRDSILDLVCFKFLIERSSEEHYFDIKKVHPHTYRHFDLIYDILAILKDKYPKYFVKPGNTEKKAAALASEALEYFTSTHFQGVLWRKRWRILVDIYGYFNDEVYEYNGGLTPELLRSLLEKGADPDLLPVETSDQLDVVLPHIKDRSTFGKRVILNAGVESSDAICPFELAVRLGLDLEDIKRTAPRFIGLLEAAMPAHFVLKTCLRHGNLENFRPKALEILEGVFDQLSNKHKMIAASFTDKTLSLDDFTAQEIDELMQYSVHVFPKEYFLRGTFRSSALHFFKQYPEYLSELIKKDKLNAFISRFAGTRPEHVVRHITEVDDLSKYLSELPKDEILRLYQLSTSPKFKLVYLFHLRDTIEQFDVDYATVFEFFLQYDFLAYLLQKGNNIPSFIDNTVAYLNALPFKNTVMYRGFNFDTEPQFYYNLCLPERDACVKLLYAVLSSIRIDTRLEFLLHILETILFVPVAFSDKLKRRLRQPDGESKFRALFDLKDKSFIIDRLLYELPHAEPYDKTVTLETLDINPRKAQDVILRTVVLPGTYLLRLSPSFLSNEALERVISKVCKPSCAEDFSLVGCNIFEGMKVFNPRPSISLNEEMESLNLTRAPDQAGNPLMTLPKRFFETVADFTLTDFVYLLETDEIFGLPEFRVDRFAIYDQYVTVIAREYSETFINMYSMSKLENSDDDAVFELIVQPLSKLRYSFWLVLSKTLFLTNNIYISFFIEKMLIRYITSTGSHFLKEHGIISLEEYVAVCCEAELSLLALALPNLYCKLEIRRSLKLEGLIKASIDRKIDNGRVTYSCTGDGHKLRFLYRADSLTHEANITIPPNFPEKKARIEFEGSGKNRKFYHKLNEILSRTGKFIEVFLLWKIDIDNHLMGYTECLICYFIMEPKYRTLPDFECPVCKNCFHDRCIFKWAAESRTPLCPFCRSELPLWGRKDLSAQPR